MLLGIILTIITLAILYVKSTIYSIIFCLQTISFATKHVTSCYICPNFSFPLSFGDICEDGS